MLRDSFRSGKFWNNKISTKNFSKSSAWPLIFHAITSLFYLRMLFIFMSAKKILLAGRMITTWYLMFHIGFIFLRLIQNSISLTNAKKVKFNKMFSKFNNLIFISLIFPFALYIPLVYWLLFCYDSNIMFPNFIEISLPPWMSMSSHAVVLLVTLMETTTAKYSYDGNHFNSLIIMSVFLASYLACLVGTYLQYGFWLYPIFHLLPSSCLPFVFLMLTALLIFTYLIGVIITQRFHGTAVAKSRKKLATATDAKKSSPAINAVIENNEEYAKEDAKKIVSSPSSAVIENNEEYANDAKKNVPSPANVAIENNEEYAKEDVKKSTPSSSTSSVLVTENNEELAKDDAKEIIPPSNAMTKSREKFTMATDLQKSLPSSNAMTESNEEVKDDAKKILSTSNAIKGNDEEFMKDDIAAMTENNEEAVKDYAKKIVPTSNAAVTENNEEFMKDEVATIARSNDEKVVKNDTKKIMPTSNAPTENNEEFAENDVAAITESHEKVAEDDANKIAPTSIAANKNNDEFAKNDAKETSFFPTSSGEFQSKDEKYANSSFVVLRKVLEKVVFSPLRSNIQKMFLDEKQHRSSKDSNATNSVKLNNEYSDADDGMKSSPYLTVEKDRRISSEAVPKFLKQNEEFKFKDEHAEQEHEEKFHYSIEAIDDNYALNISLIANKKNANDSKSTPTNQNANRKFTQDCGINSIPASQSDHEARDIQKPSTSSGLSGNCCNYGGETADKIEHSYENYGNHEAGDKIPKNENAHSMNPTKHENERSKKKNQTYRFQLKLFPDNCTEILPKNEERKKTRNPVDENCDKKMPNSKTKNEILTLSSRTHIENKMPTETKDQKLEESITKKDENCRICKASQKAETKNTPEPDRFALKFNIRGLLKLKPISSNPNAISSSCEDTNKPELKPPGPRTNDADVAKKMEEKSRQCPHDLDRENISCDELHPAPSTSKTDFLNPSFMNCLSNMEQTPTTNSTDHNKSGEKNKKRRKRNKKRETKKDECANESKNELLNVVVELENIQFHELDKTDSGEKNKKRDLKIDEKKDTKTIDNKRACSCKKHGLYFFKTRIDPLIIFRHRKCNCKKMMKLEENEFSNSPIYSVPKCPDHHVPKTCDQLLSKKINENGIIKDEKPRYVLPKSNAQPTKAHLSHSCSTIEEECEEEKPTKKDTSADKSIQDCSTGNNMKKKITARIFNFPKPNQNSQNCRKKLKEISNKDTKETKIEAIFTPIPRKNELQPNSEFNAEILQNLRETLVPDGSERKLYKFCAILS